MSHYPDLDAYHIRERNEGLLREVSILRLEKRLRENREPRSGRLAAFVSSGTLPLRKVRLVR
jgi:hypothetical protein